MLACLLSVSGESAEPRHMLAMCRRLDCITNIAPLASPWPNRGLFRTSQPRHHAWIFVAATTNTSMVPERRAVSPCALVASRGETNRTRNNRKTDSDVDQWGRRVPIERMRCISALLCASIASRLAYSALARRSLPGLCAEPRSAVPSNVFHTTPSRLGDQGRTLKSRCCGRSLLPLPPRSSSSSLTAERPCQTS